MKFRNVKKAERAAWTKVSLNNNDYSKEILSWCRKQASSARFYRYYGTSSWWFEDPQDATMFLLRWA